MLNKGYYSVCTIEQNNWNKQKIARIAIERVEREIQIHCIIIEIDWKEILKDGSWE